MEAGRSGKKTGAIIQGRMQSSRLPGKIIMPLPIVDGKPLLECIIDSLKESNYLDEIILATSSKPENDILESIASKNNIGFFRGSESDVLSRFVSVAEIYQLETIVRVTADNPILDIQLLDRLILHHHKKNNDYSHSSHLPLGMNMEIVSARVLKEISSSHDITNEDCEHVTMYIERNRKFMSEIISLYPVSLTEKVRLTVDYPVDYALACLLFTISNAENKKGMELINWINNHYPWIWEINIGAYQKKRYGSLNEELDAAIKILNEAEFIKAAQMLKVKQNEIRMPHKH